ncbi:uncharacterized protein DFL_004769 [Arthrobotrys flagrans]|uniref:Uncharacterized protein n=1 Tax=Arthrobotrys flagrans TaxID=97331 RepID=A0A437A5X7_ARTFL|nr:hypothetical protein DFL_004769 [Arthrobotrys flagrans]
MRTLSTNQRRAGVVLAMVPVIVNAAPAATAIRRRDDDDDDDDDDNDDDDKDDKDDDDDDDDDKKDRKDGDKFTSIDLGFSFTTVEVPTPIEPTSAPPPRQTRSVDEGPQFGSVEPLPGSTATSPPSAKPTTSPQFGAVPGEDERETTSSSGRKTTSTATTKSVEAERTEPSSTSSGISTALPGAADGDNASPTPQVGESAGHIRMEIGIGLGVLGFFLILSVAIFLWLKRRRRGNGSMWGTVKSIGRRRRNEGRGPIEPNMSHTYESRAMGDRDEWPAVPDAAILSNNDVKRLSECMSDIERFTSLRRKYTISRSIDIPVDKPVPPAPRGRMGSTSSYVTMTVAGHLPQISSSGFDDSFLENIDEHQDHTFRDPFADPYSPTTSSLPPAPPPLRFPVKPTAPIQTGRIRAMHKYNASDESLELTDPRILSPGGRLVITNRSREDSVPSLPPSPPRKKGMMRTSGHAIPLPLRVNREQPPRFPWNNRESGLSVNSEGPARHRGVKSWVNHEVEIRERYPTIEEVDSPRYAQSEATLYNRYSINSGMDTRRTEYEY